MKEDFRKVLIIDSDQISNQVIDRYLKISGYESKMILNGKEIKKIFLEYKPDIVLLDLLANNINGMDFLKWIRNQSNIPIIVITKKDDIFDKVLALNLGADDYVLKPFEPEELIARIKAILRRCSIETPKNEIISLHNLSINLESYEVCYKDNLIKLPPKEFELLVFLISNPNRVFTRKELISKVWGCDYEGDNRTIDVHVKRLREKINKNEEFSIKTIWGIGYKFEKKKN